MSVREEVKEIPGWETVVTQYMFWFFLAEYTVRGEGLGGWSEFFEISVSLVEKHTHTLSQKKCAKIHGHSPTG